MYEDHVSKVHRPQRHPQRHIANRMMSKSSRPSRSVDHRPATTSVDQRSIDNQSVTPRLVVDMPGDPDIRSDPTMSAQPISHARDSSNRKRQLSVAEKTDGNDGDDDPQDSKRKRTSTHKSPPRIIAKVETDNVVKTFQFPTSDQDKLKSGEKLAGSDPGINNCMMLVNVRLT
jgi:hypothetical protein